MNEASEDGDESKQDLEKTKGKTDLDNEAPVADIIELEQGLKNAPPEVRKIIQSFLMSISSHRGPVSNPLFEKFNDAHIDKYLDYMQRDDDNAYELAKTNRWFYAGYVAAALVFLGAIIIYLLPTNPALLEKIIEFLLVFAGGFGAGYGVKSKQSE